MRYIQRVFIEHPLCARRCAGAEGETEKTSSLPWRSMQGLGQAATPMGPAHVHPTTAGPGSSVSSWGLVTASSHLSHHQHISPGTDFILQSFTHPSTKHSLSTYYVLDIVLGCGQVVVNTAQSPSPSREAIDWIAVTRV